MAKEKIIKIKYKAGDVVYHKSNIDKFFVVLNSYSNNNGDVRINCQFFDPIDNELKKITFFNFEIAHQEINK
jgi:hypothetical protein